MNIRIQKLVSSVLAVVMIIGIFAVCNVPVITTADAAIVSTDVMPLDTDTDDTSDKSEYDFQVGDIVEIKEDALDYYGESISWVNSLWDYTVTAVDGDKVTIITTYFDLYDVIKDMHAKDLILVSRPSEKDSDVETDTMEDEPFRISVGSDVGLNLGAMDYYGNSIKTFWYALIYTVTEIKGDKATIEVVLTPSVIEEYAGITEEEIAEIFDADPDSITFQFIYNAIMSFGYTEEFEMNVKDIHLISGGISVDELPSGTYRTTEDVVLYEVAYDSDSDILYTRNKIDEIPEDYQLVLTDISEGGYACVYYGENADDGIFGHVDVINLELVTTEALCNNEKFEVGNIVNIYEDCKQYYNGKTFASVGVTKDRINTPSIYKAPFVIKQLLGDAVVLSAFSSTLSKNEYYNDIIVGAGDIYFSNGTYKNQAQTTTYKYNSRTGEFTASTITIPANTKLYYTGQTGIDDADDAVLSVVYKGETSYVAARALDFVSTEKTTLSDYDIGDEVYLDPEVTKDYWNEEFEDYSVSWTSYFGKSFTDELLHNAVYEVIDTYNDFVVIRETERSADKNNRKTEPSEKYDLFVHMDDISDEIYEGININGDVVYGDVNDDGKVTMTDVTDIQKYIAKLERFTADQKTAADVKGDDDVALSDVVLIQQYIAKLIKEFPVEK